MKLANALEYKLPSIAYIIIKDPTGSNYIRKWYAKNALIIERYSGVLFVNRCVTE